jgi:hypothetical protein
MIKHDTYHDTCVDRPFSNGGQLMCHEGMHHQMQVCQRQFGSTWAFDAPAQNFVSGITAPLRGLIM